jgi:hypothetical protein
MVGSEPNCRGEDNMTAPGRDLPRPEDATSWEEFRARYAAERAVWRPSASPAEARSQLVLGLVFGFGAAAFWTGTVLAEGVGTWALLALAVLSAWMFVRHFTAGARRGALGRRRYWELVWLSGQWRARVARARAVAAGEQARSRAVAAGEQARSRAVAAGEQARAGVRTAGDQERAGVRTKGEQARAERDRTLSAWGERRDP